MIPDSQRIDYLFKKLGYGAAKTDKFDIKSPSNEPIPSYLLMRGDNVWLKSHLIPSTPPLATNDEIRVYKGLDRIECVQDITSTPNRTWKTNLKDWIPTEFGALYIINIYIDIPGAVNPSLTGTKLFPDGSGNSDFWFFDYQSGILNFSDTNLPAGIAGKSVFVEGYRYIGLKGIQNISGGGSGELPPLVTDEEIIQRTEEAIRSWSPYKIFQALASYFESTRIQGFYPSSFYNDKPDPNQVLLMTIIVGNDVTFPINFTGSQGHASVPATIDSVFIIQKNDVNIGTMTFMTGSNNAIFSLSSETIFNSGDKLKIISPGIQDATLSKISVTLYGFSYRDNNVFYPSSFYDAKPEVSQTILMLVIINNEVVFPINFVGSQGYAKIASTSNAIFKIQKNGIDIGTMTFIAGSNIASFSLNNKTIFTIGDVLSVIAPEIQDDTLYGIALTLAGSRNG